MTGLSHPPIPTTDFPLGNVPHAGALHTARTLRDKPHGWPVSRGGGGTWHSVQMPPAHCHLPVSSLALTQHAASEVTLHKRHLTFLPSAPQRQESRSLHPGRFVLPQWSSLGQFLGSKEGAWFPFSLIQLFRAGSLCLLLPGFIPQTFSAPCAERWGD